MELSLPQLFHLSMFSYQKVWQREIKEESVSCQWTIRYIRTPGTRGKYDLRVLICFICNTGTVILQWQAVVWLQYTDVVLSHKYHWVEYMESSCVQVSGEESPGVLSNEDLPDSPTDGDLDEESLTSNMPWLKVCQHMSILFFISVEWIHPQDMKHDDRGSS